MALCLGVRTVAAPLLLALTACGGALSIVDGGDSSDAADAALDGDPDAAFGADALDLPDAFAFPDSSSVIDAAAPCPTVAPTLDAGCSSTRICEYGSTTTLACNQLFQCFATDCSPYPPTWHALRAWETCASPRPPGCPPAFSDALDGGSACPGSTECAYPAGSCACVGGAWQCRAALASCPSQPPQLGTACNVTMGPQDECPFDGAGFGAYPLCSARGYRCVGGYWTAVLGCGVPPPPCR